MQCYVYYVDCTANTVYALLTFSDHYHMSIAMAHTGLLGGEIPSGQRWFHGQGNAPPGTMPQ